MNLTNRPAIRHSVSGLLLAAFLALSTAAPAAPGDLSQVPLFLATGAEPNIFFVLDDSGSMDAEIMVKGNVGFFRYNQPNGTDVADAGAIKQRSSATSGSGDCTEGAWNGSYLYGVEFASNYENDDGVADCYTADDQAWRFRNSDFNPLYFDPTKDYTPWTGTNSYGQPYQDIDITNAPDNPYLFNFAAPPGNSETIDLTLHSSNWAGEESDPTTLARDASIGNGFFFYTWSDADDDGNFDDGEETGYRIATVSQADIDAAGWTNPDGSTKTVADLQQDFANWFSYYRKREYVLKGAVSSVVADAKVRMGIASLWNRNGVATPIRDMSDTTATSDCGADKTNKDCLLSRLFSLDSGDKTPLRRALDEAGHYFDQTDGGLYHEYLGSGEASPILSEAEHGDCQQNFVILVSDGYWNQSWPTTDSAGQTLTSHGDADSDNSSAWDGGAQADGVGVAEPASCTDDMQPGDPITVDTLADIAMHYYETDLSSLPDKVGEVPGVDENTQQHLVTFTVAFGVEGNLTDDPPNRTDPFPWPPICDHELWAVDDMRHAAWNGRGDFLSARSPEELVGAISDAVITSVDRVASVGLEFNTSSLTSNTLVFLANVDSSDWSSDLLAYNLQDLLDNLAANAADADPSNDGRITLSPEWSAASKLDELTNAEALDRVVITRGASGDGIVVATSTWDDLTTEMQDDLKAVTGADSGLARLEYLLGDRSCEVALEGDSWGTDNCLRDVNGDTLVDAQDKSLRRRGSRLGDIFDGVPLVVGIPTTSWPSIAPFPATPGTTFSDFKTGLTTTPRTEVVYVGANDGMLHGFATKDGAGVSAGQEVLAYMPSSLASTATNKGYHYLTDPDYTHRFYVDRTPTVNHVYINTGDGGGLKWHTVAVGGLGAGGRGLYALDINDPLTFDIDHAADILLWEFTSSDDDELGLTVSEPTIVMTNYDRNGDGINEWAVIVGSGYNDTGTDLNAHLFIIFLDGGLDGVWTEGTDYIKIEAPDSITATPLNPGDDPDTWRNGLSSPKAADLDGNGTTDRVYAGDLFGNLWAFDLCDPDANGTCTKTTPGEWITANTGLSPLFTAEVSGVRQPITVEPTIAKHPTQADTAGNYPNVMLYFGTGQYLTQTDLDTTGTQSFYGIWDSGTSSLDRSNLQVQTFDANFANNEVLTDSTVDWSTKFGWYFDLPDSGERVVTDALLRQGIVFFNSIVPSSDPCTGGGRGFQYTVDMTNGGPPEFAAFDYNNNGTVDVSDVATGADSTTENPSRVSFGGEVPTGSVFLGNQEYTGSSDGTIQVREVFEIDASGRLSWQELNSF